MSVIRALLAAWLIGWAPPAAADDETVRTAQAKEIYKLALADFNAGRFEDAMEKFAAGWALKPQPLFLYNAAQAARRAGKSQRAVELFKQFLSVDPQAPERAEALKYIDELSPVPPQPPVEMPAPVAPPPAPPAPAPAPAVTAPITVAAPRPREIAGPVLLGIGSAALLGGAIVLGVGAPAVQSAQDDYESFDAGRRAVPMVVSGAVVLGVGAALITAGAIRLGVRASPSTNRRSER
jgi:tetratricopeptide (TPR) repeat protein